MQLLALLAPVLAPVAAAPVLPQSPLASSPRMPSVYESGVQARRILQLNGIGTISTVFPSSSSSVGALERRPADVSEAPIGLMEYYATCGAEPFNPTIIGVTIATSMKNAAAGSNVTLSMRYVLPSDAPMPPPDPWAYLPANLPRFALVGYLEKLDEKKVKEDQIKACFLKTHPESTIWMPGTDIHESWWGRLVVKEVYFFGGFGDRSRIGWLPIKDWQGISQKEVDEYRMVGEQGYQESQKTWRALYDRQNVLEMEL